MSQIQSIIKNIQDEMRKDAGLDGDAQRISQLVWMLFLKIFDDREKNLELIDKELFPALRALSVSPTDTRGFLIKNIFSDTYNYMKNGTLIRKVFNKINEINFNKKDDRHAFGDLYEKILKDLQNA